MTPRWVWFALVALFLSRAAFGDDVIDANAQRADLDAVTRQLQGGSCRYDLICGKQTRTWGWFLRNPEWTCRESAATCLGYMGEKARPAVPILVGMLDEREDFDTGDGVIQMRAAYVEALGKIGDPAAIPPLLEVLNHSKPAAQRAAVDALGRFGPKAAAAVGDLLKILGVADPSLQAGVAEALGEIQDANAVGPLTDLLKKAKNQNEKDVMRAVVSALAKFGPRAAPALPVLLKHFEDRPEPLYLYTHALVKIDPEGKQVIPALRQLLRQKDPELRRSGISALGRIRSPAVYESLVKALKDPSPLVRVGAANALRNRCEQKGAKPLLKTLGDPDVEVRRAAAAALIDLHPPAEGVAPLSEALDDPDLKVRTYAALALGRMGKAALPALARLEKLSDDPDPGLRSNARWSVKQLQGLKEKEGL